MRSVFFSFHFDRDSWRVSQVRNSWLIQPNNRKGSLFLDKARWEEIKKEDENIKNWIDKQLLGTSVTIVLIGAETSGRKWVEYEIEQSYKRGNGLLGIYIHQIKTPQMPIDTKGVNPFSHWFITNKDGTRTYFSEMYSTYDWVNDDGRNNIDKWIEAAAKQVGK